MATDYSLTMKCNVCNRTVTITDTTDAAQKRGKYYQCGECGNVLSFRPSSIMAKHSGNVGSNTTITLTVASGTISSSAVS